MQWFPKYSSQLPFSPLRRHMAQPYCRPPTYNYPGGLWYSRGSARAPPAGPRRPDAGVVLLVRTAARLWAAKSTVLGSGQIGGDVSKIRLTIIDDTGAVSFVGPAHGAKVLTAACSARPANVAALLAAARPYDAHMVDQVLDGLAIFDEHNGPERYQAIHTALTRGHHEPFRVVDSITRTVSLEPVETGVILFNLTAQRIVQVQNSYSVLLRRDRGRIRAAGKPTRQLYRYELPQDWSIVP
jgi:hypothetical protein